MSSFALLERVAKDEDGIATACDPRSRADRENPKPSLLDTSHELMTNVSGHSVPMSSPTSQSVHELPEGPGLVAQL
ncbi:hypothetical protein CHELA20_50122 [Hyphomicrobiales bacterium]|nr:hypothetical protein CHELA41_20249 [Hyphomicrobiales bacterium]CAH1666838.1 hypothetical protein CHELA20_50122 [Hyphomicrobiales bacterium]